MKFNLSTAFRTTLVALALALPGASGAQAYSEASQEVTESMLVETATRKIYFPAASLSYSSSSITRGAYGLNVPSTTADAVTLILPRPSDAALAVSTDPIEVTLYFAIPSASVPNNYRWQLRAQSRELDLNGGGTGWDSLDNYNIQNGTLITYPADSAFTNLMKSQTWTATWSSQYSTWYFGSGVNTGNDFSGGPIWKFGFVRGKAVNNGETNTGSFTIVGAEVSYLAYR